MKLESAEEFINNNGYPTWYTQTSDTEGEVVINSGDCI